MSSRARCGLSPHQREQFLRENGYEPMAGGTGKGSHVVWINREMEELSAKRKLAMPANIRSNPNQSPCTVLLCSDPAGGTWKSIVAQVEWCQNTLEQQARNDQLTAEQRAKKAEFRIALEEVCTFRRGVSHFMRGYVEAMPEAPSASIQMVMTMRVGR